MVRSLKHLCVIFVLSVALVVTGMPERLFVPDASHVAEAQERKKKRGFFDRLFGRKKKKRAPVVVSPNRDAERRQKAKRRAAAAQRRREATAALPKIPDANQILVIGDATANALSQGLTGIYRRTPSVEVTTKITSDLAVINDGFYNWIDASDFTFVGPRVRAVVISLGTFDRFALRDGARRIAFGSEDWNRQYRRRLVDITAQLQLMGVPVIWVLPPPVINNEETQKIQQIAALQQASLQTTSFRIVNPFGGFTNGDGLYRKTGPSITGARVTLRTFDGLGFTSKGQAKLAFYVRQEIDLLLENELGFASLETEVRQERRGQQVVNLTRPALRPNAQLSGANGRTSAFYTDVRARQYFVSGKALKAPEGRADNFKWGDGAREKATAARENRESPTFRW